jgi:hypothetical protein
MAVFCVVLYRMYINSSLRSASQVLKLADCSTRRKRQWLIYAERDCYLCIHNTGCFFSGNVKVKIYKNLNVYVEGSLSEGCEYLGLKRGNNWRLEKITL